MRVRPLTSKEIRLFVKKQNALMTNKIFDLLDDPNLFLGKVYVLLGEFGSGKTTLVNYIRYNFAAKKIAQCPIDISWNNKIGDIKNSSIIRDWFIDELKKKLLFVVNQALIKSTSFGKVELNETKNILANEDLDETGIAQVFEVLINQGHFNTFTILIDELHRLKKYIHILDFLKYEQTLLQDLCKMPIAIFVAGHSEWMKHLKLRDYSGIFDEKVLLPKWDSKSAYLLIDKRLRDAASDPSEFINPFTKDALDYIPRKEKCNTPRDWIILCKKILENCPDDIGYVSPILVSRILRVVDKKTIQQLQILLTRDYKAANDKLETILRKPHYFASDMFNVIAFLYHQPLLASLKRANAKLGINNAQLVIDSLIELNIIQTSNTSKPPVRIHRKFVELPELSSELYVLTEDLANAFKKIQEEFALIPEQYLLSIFQISPLEKEKDLPDVKNENSKQLQSIYDNCIVPRAKDHSQRAKIFYEKFINNIFSDQSVDRTNDDQTSYDQATLRYASVACFNIISTFIIERTGNPSRKINFVEDLNEYVNCLNIKKETVSTILWWYTENKEVESTAKTLAHDVMEELRTRANEIFDELIAQLYKWCALSSIERENVCQTHGIEAWQRNSSHSRLRISTSGFIITTIKKIRLDQFGHVWVDQFLDFLEENSIEKGLYEAINIRCNSQDSQTKLSTYRRSLQLLSEVFEDTLNTMMQHSIDQNIIKTHEKQKLHPKEILEKFRVLEGPAWDKFQPDMLSRDNPPKLEEMIEGLLKEKRNKNPHFVRFVKTALLINACYARNDQYSSRLNSDESLYQKCVDALVYSIVAPFKIISDTGKIKGFEPLVRNLKSTLTEVDIIEKNKIPKKKHEHYSN